MANVRVCVLSDSRLFCESMQRLLGDASEIDVTACCEASLAGVLRRDDPHVALVDAQMAGALPRCAAFSAEGGPSPILVGAPDDDGWAEQALTAGARGIITRTAPTADVLRAVRAVRAGSIWARRRWVDAALTCLAAGRHRPAPGLELHARLSEREREVFRYAAAGLGNKQLAERLYISEATVKVHMTHIFQKLGVNGRAELAAAYHGLIARPRAAEAGTQLVRHES